MRLRSLGTLAPSCSGQLGRSTDVSECLRRLQAGLRSVAGIVNAAVFSGLVFLVRRGEQDATKDNDPDDDEDGDESILSAVDVGVFVAHLPILAVQGNLRHPA